MGKNVVTVVVAALVVGGAVWLGFHFFATDQTLGISGPPKQAGNATPTGSSLANESAASEPAIKASDISALELKTSYPGYFESRPECGKAAACQIRIRVDRALSAERVFSDGKGGGAKEAVSRATLTPEQFERLAALVAANDAVTHWREGMTLYASNSSVRIEFGASRSKTVPSNVDEKTSSYLPMIEAFKQLDNALDWTVSK